MPFATVGVIHGTHHSVYGTDMPANNASGAEAPGVVPTASQGSCKINSTIISHLPAVHPENLPSMHHSNATFVAPTLTLFPALELLHLTWACVSSA